MNWRAGALMGLAAFVLVCGWWLVKAVELFHRVGDLQAVWKHAEMADPGTILTRALIALIVGLVAGAYLGGRAQALLEEAVEEREGFALLRANGSGGDEDRSAEVRLDSPGAVREEQ